MALMDHQEMALRVAQTYMMRQGTRVPLNMQWTRDTIGRLWVGGDGEDARDLLRQTVQRFVADVASEKTRGRSGTLPLSFARWFIDQAPHGMDTREFEQMLPRTASSKTAGEVRFIKDRGGDHNEWGWNPPGANDREIDPNYKFDAKNLEPLARTLRSALMALGHIQTARTVFTKIKGQRISPDGNIGGKGYVMPLKDIRKQLSNCDEALSSITDTIYDEINAVHWHPDVDDSGGDPRARAEVKEVMDDVEEIKEDPEDWAEKEEAEMDAEGGGDAEGVAKMASLTAAQRVAALYIARRAR